MAPVVRPLLFASILGAGCSDSATMSPPLYVAGAPFVVSGTLSVPAEARNPGAGAITFELMSPCTATIRVYTSGSVLAWDQLAWLNARPGGCKWAPRPVTLEPGQTRPLLASADVAQILGDSLASGSYRVAVVVSQGSPAPGLVEVSAGEVSLVK